MSAFIVEKSCVDRAISLWMADHQGGAVGWGGGYSCDQADKLGQDVMRLNVQAVDVRYGTGDVAAWETFIAAYRYPLKHVARIDALKALQCIIYQCSEGDKLESSNTYKAMKTMEVDALRHVVNGLPEYEAAQWG